MLDIIQWHGGAKYDPKDSELTKGAKIYSVSGWRSSKRVGWTGKDGSPSPILGTIIKILW